MNKYLLGSSGAIGKELFLKGKGWIGITRENFCDFLVELTVVDGDVEIINAASLSRVNLLELVKVLNSLSLRVVFHHFSSTAIHKDTSYGRAKLLEENLLRSCLGSNVNLNILSLSLPVIDEQGSLRAFGYWDNLIFRGGVLGTYESKINLLSIGEGFNVTELDGSDLREKYKVMFIRLLPGISLLDKVPVRYVNKFLSIIRIQIFR